MKVNQQIVRIVRILLLHCLLLQLAVACTNRDRNQEATQQDADEIIKKRTFTPAEIKEGETLSRQYCRACHLYTPPEVIPRRIWQDDVLPRMGAFYGFYEKQSRAELVETGPARTIVLNRNVYPFEPVIDTLAWEKIKAYYLESAPDELAVEDQGANLEVKKIFQLSEPKGNRIVPPMATMIKVSEANQLIYHSDVKKDVSTLNIYDREGNIIQAIGMRSPAARLREKDGALWVLAMGSFTSSDAPKGNLVKITKKGGSALYNSVEIMIDSLRRPVDLAYADFDQDGDEDVVIAEYGNWAGQLRWFRNQGNDQYENNMLLPITGPTRVMVDDLNQDGWMDILAMIAQGDESVYALINQQNGTFLPQKIIQVPPSYGSVYFDYLDLDGDGVKDILHVAGDNADYEAIPKPYHGIRIFKGLPDLQFEETWFFPQNGAYKTIPADFDGDGDLDLASISFFPDFSGSGKESLIMLENVSNGTKLKYNAFAIDGYDTSRWIVMDSGDLNGDGKPDLVAGSFVVQDPYGAQEGLKQEWMQNSPMFLIMENIWQNSD